MHTVHKLSFRVAGISVRTSNEAGRAATDIPQLWHRFLSEGIMDAIPGRIDDTIYCIYTDYELDHTRPYTTVLGCRIGDSEIVPEGFTSVIIEAADYTVFTAKGKISDGIVFNTWNEIWAADTDRAFIADFEVYDEKSRDMDNAAVGIFVGLKGK